MKNTGLPVLTKFFGALLMSLAVSVTVFAYPSGSPAGYTGSPGDGQHCVSCHGGSAATVSGWITSNIPPAGYTAGTAYTITVTVSGSGKKGFEVSPQNASGAQLGVLAAGTGNKLVGGTKYVTQSSSGSTSSTVSWSFTWTAPVAGTGNVTLYGAFTVGKSNTKLSTLVVSENTAVPLSATATANPSTVCAGQTSQLNVVPAGGSGSYTYSWTSVPAGFTSSLPNPVVTPTVTTQYIAHVSDGSLSSDAPTNVNVNQPATASAGNDTSCAYYTSQIPLNGACANYTTVLWTTSGTGTFSAAGSTAGTYFPSTADKDGGNVTLTLTASAQSPCSVAAVDTRVIHFDGPTGISDAQAQAGMTVSPNPSTGIFYLRVSGIEGTNTTVTVSDICGRQVFLQTMEFVSAKPEQINLAGQPKGLYLLKIQTSGRSLVRKLVIE